MLEPVLVGLGAVIAALVAALITRGVKISEFRQAWINELRDDISLYMSRAHEWIDVYINFNSESDQLKKSEIAPTLDRLKYDGLHILRRIELRFKVNDAAGNDLLDMLRNLLDPEKLERGRQYASWRESADNAIVHSRILLKEEWEVTKSLCKNMVKRRSK